MQIKINVPAHRTQTTFVTELTTLGRSGAARLLDGLVQLGIEEVPD